MSYQKDRDEFIGQMVTEVQAKDGTNNEGVDLARLILRNASTIQRCEELVCNSEAADRDRVPCPSRGKLNTGECLCRHCGTYADATQSHGKIPRVEVQILRARQRIEAACEPWGIVPSFQSDPRGCCVKLLLPSGRWNSWGGEEDGFCVPTR